MTLLATSRGRDCILALSDRMESVDQSDPNEVTKFCLSYEGGFYIALSGDGKSARYLLNKLRPLQPSGDGIFREIDRVVAGMSEMFQWGHVAGHLIVPDGSEFKVYSISVASGIFAYYQLADPTHAEGDARAVAIYKRLARDIPMSDMPCETAARCLHTMASYIAETVDTVGRSGKYGFDMAVFARSGTMTQLRRRTDTMGSICARFEASDAGPIFGPDVGAGGA